MPTSASYLMPVTEATAELPWDRIYKVPGLAQMRATYRWSAVTRLALIVLAAVAVEWLLTRGRRRTLVIGVAIVAISELVPNVPSLLAEYHHNYKSRAALDAALIPDLRAATRHRDLAFSSVRMVTTTTT